MESGSCKGAEHRCDEKWLAQEGLDPSGGPPEEFLDRIKRDIEKWKKVVKEAMFLFEEAQDPNREISFVIDQDRGLPEFRFDPDQIKRVLINLLDNAVAAVSEVPDPRILIRTQFDSSLKIVRISVSDNGSGIPMQDRDRVFEPYFSTKESGTGLGLAIVRRIVEDHNGFIRALPNEPHGTRILVELPVAETDASPVVRTPVLGMVGGDSIPDTSGKRR